MRDIMISENQLTFFGILQDSRNDAQRNLYGKENNGRIL
jgi:hypothetical protein